MVYFGSSLSLSSISSNVYFSMFVVGVCETLSNIFCAVFAHKLPRKKCLIAFFSVTIIICMGFVFFPYSETNEALT